MHLPLNILKGVYVIRGLYFTTSVYPFVATVFGIYSYGFWV